MSSGILWWAAVHRTPGAYMKSPSFCMLIENRPYFLFASAAPTDVPGPLPSPPPPSHPTDRYGLSKFQNCRSKPLPHPGMLVEIAPPTSDQSSFLMTSQISAVSRPLAIGLESQAYEASSRARSISLAFASVNF